MAITNTSKLSALIHRKGITMHQLAIKLSISPAMFTKIMRGWKDPSLELAARMAKELDCTVDDLISK